MRILLVCLLCPILLSAQNLWAREPKLEPGKVHQLASPKHDRPYWLFVPSKYSKKKSWPLVISSHGAGGSGKGEMRPWRGLANTHGFIVACPDMVTATNHRKQSSTLPASEEDDDVVMSIVDFVSSKFRVNRRAVMITGYSGGGNPSYHTGLRHPDVFTHICTRGGNFAPQQIPDEETIARGRKHLQIYIFFGERDHVYIIGKDGNSGHAHDARDALKEAGYENVRFEKVPGMGHESRPQTAAKWLGEYVAGNKQRFKAGDQADQLLAKAEVATQKRKYRDAIKHLRKAEALEKKHALRPVAPAKLAAVDEAGKALLEEARRTREGGDAKAALKQVAEVARDFKGLPSGAAARELAKAWKAGG